jgi:adenosine tuberculosinyltransferase
MNARPSPPSLPEWLSWPAERVSRWVSAQPEPVVMGWPYNGTRRWYVAHRRQNPGVKDYLEVLIRRQAEHHRLVFDHGVSVILAPSFGAETLKRGEEYTRYALEGLLQLSDDEVYRGLIDSGVRIRFYGDYEEALAAPSFRPVLEACATLTDATASGDGPLLLIGLFADDPFPTIARLSVELVERKGRVPNREELIEAYYGLPVPDLSLYVGFAQPEMFDVPLLTTGLEHLYVTLNPSPDLTEGQLREILYDHLVTRRAAPVDYDTLSPEAELEIAEYNERCRGKTLGIGRVDALTGLWRPLLPGLTDRCRHKPS